VAAASIDDTPKMQLTGMLPLHLKGLLTMATETAKPKAPRAKAAPKAPAKKAPAMKAAKASKAATAAAPASAFDASQLKDQAGTMINQATDKIKGAANRGRETAGGAMGGIAAMVDDVAKSIDEKLGVQYGDYARKAASAVNGVADTLNTKDVDALMDDAREFVRKKPAVAIGIAAAVGFALTRLIKAGDDK
jgi:ElaB/YqjD/DUF883 family membrane-anchored ribosome-binding protein